MSHETHGFVPLTYANKNKMKRKGFSKSNDLGCTLDEQWLAKTAISLDTITYGQSMELATQRAPIILQSRKTVAKLGNSKLLAVVKKLDLPPPCLLAKMKCQSWGFD